MGGSLQTQAACLGRDGKARSRSFGLPKEVEVAALTKLLSSFNALTNEKIPADIEDISLAEVCEVLDLPMPAPRPKTASGTFLRIITVNDIYQLKHYPALTSAIKQAKALAEAMDYVCLAFHNGDFVSPNVLTSLDGGKAMTQVLDQCGLDYACLGNHEFDLGFDDINANLSELLFCKVINSNVTSSPLDSLPKSDLITIGDKQVLVGGFLEADNTIYPPKRRPAISHVQESMTKLWDDVSKKSGQPHLFLPMTHQVIKSDRDLASNIAKARPDIAARMPVILAGHDHEVFVDEAGQSTVVKVGIDGSKIGFVDIWWDDASVLHSSVSVLPISEFPPNQVVKTFCDAKVKFVNSMMAAALTTLTEPMSSVRVRFEETSMATFLLSLLKRSLVNEGVELVMVQGGGIRAGKDYTPGPFTMADLYSEFPFATEIGIVDLPGSIIIDSVKASRLSDKPAPSFLHVDGSAEANDEHELVKIDGAAAVREQTYKVGLPIQLLTGLNAIEPLTSYAAKNITVPSEESCPRAKEAIINLCMKDMWRSLMGLDAWDAKDCQQLPAAQLSKKVNESFKEIDTNGDGRLTPAEIGQAMEKRFGERPGAALLRNMLEALDTDNDGKISMQELASVVH